MPGNSFESNIDIAIFKPQIGAGRNLVDLTYVENVADALVLAVYSATRLFPRDELFGLKSSSLKSQASLLISEAFHTVFA